MRLLLLSMTVFWLALGSVLASDQKAAAPQQQPKMECLSDKAVIKEIKKKQIDLNQWETSLKAKEQELETAKKAFEEELKKLELIRKEIGALRQDVDQKNEEKVSKLVETFEKMSPKATAGLLANLDDKLAVAAMNRISTDRLAKVLNLMSTDRASQLTELMTLGKSKQKGGEKQ